MKLSEQVNIPVSATLAVNNLALQKKQQGERVFNLAAGEPIIPTPREIIEAAQLAMQAGKTLYSPVAGIPELRGAASSWMNRTYQANFSSKNTMVTCGGKHGFAMALQAVLNFGDEVLVISPYWVSYPTMVKLAGGVVKIIETSEESGWKVSASQIKQVCSDKTKVLILNNASNPTGVLYTKEEVGEILKVAKENGLVVISDEVYSGLVYDEHKFVSASSFPDFVENTIVVHSCSKNFAMTGWRVGLLFGPENLIDSVSKLQSQTTTGTSTISQWAAVVAFENSEVIISNIKNQMQKRRDIFVENFPGQIEKTKSGLYSFVSLKSFGVEETDSVAFCKKKLDEKNIAMVPGLAFGKEGFIRCSFGETEVELLQALQVLQT